MPEIKKFVAFAAKLKGDEKGESQIFLDRLFQAFGHTGVIEASGELEYRVRWNNTTKFADLVWPKRVLIAMKKRGEKLQKHYLQARDYWMNLTKDRACDELIEQPLLPDVSNDPVNLSKFVDVRSKTNADSHR